MPSTRMVKALKVLIAVSATFFLLFAGTGLYLLSLSSTLPDLRTAPAMTSTARTSIVYAADGSVLAEWHGPENRTLVTMDDVPDHLAAAVVAIEDSRFYEHHGVDPGAVFRALRADSADKRPGSTITQQLVKVMFAGGERTWSRKVREALLAYELENRTDKDRVLETYLNVVYFGQGAYGVQAASRTLFGKPSSELTLAESATLAGLIGSPARFSPFDHPEESRRRRDAVLGRMLEQGVISPEQELEARTASLGVVKLKSGTQRAPHFVEYVKQDLIDRLGEEAVFKGGLRVTTTLDPALQRSAERAVSALLSRKGDPSAAVVCVEHSNGHIVAMVGGKDFSADKFNLATQGRRQPGSAFKPFVLVTALKEGIRPNDTFSAAPYTVRVKDGVWSVRNYENGVKGGRVTLTEATVKSVNAAYARLMMRVGPKDVVATAKRMGISSPLEPDPAIALGGLAEGVSPLEMASAFGTIASGGLRVPPTGIARVTDDAGRVLYEPDQRERRVMPEKVAVQASLVLHEVVERGTGTGARMGAWAAGKTGTTQSYRDAWFVGYSGDLCTAVWVGYPQGQVAMTNVHGKKVTGGSYPASIWARFMRQASRGGYDAGAEPVRDGGAGKDTVRVKICPQTMLRAGRACPGAIELYLDPALVPADVCQKH